ncbi:hypothetical protein BHM03_00062122 [Ensete ventricosum]|nr:hypothetical protein BHM03_00062122 [Ensete ventricosum]
MDEKSWQRRRGFFSRAEEEKLSLRPLCLRRGGGDISFVASDDGGWRRIRIVEGELRQVSRFSIFFSLFFLLPWLIPPGNGPETAPIDGTTRKRATTVEILPNLSYVSLCSLQEAQKRMKIKKPPHILVIHLKRFKYVEQLGRYKKLSYRVVFPMELKLNNTVEDIDSEYSLFAVVVHVGSGPNHGHYVSLVKSHNHWLLFDDENVEMIDESMVQTFFGSSQEYSGNTDNGYILFYESLGGKS